MKNDLEPVRLYHSFNVASSHTHDVVIRSEMQRSVLTLVVVFVAFGNLCSGLHNIIINMHK